MTFQFFQGIGKDLTKEKWYGAALVNPPKPRKQPYNHFAVRDLNWFVIHLKKNKFLILPEKMRLFVFIKILPNIKIGTEMTKKLLILRSLCWPGVIFVITIKSWKLPKIYRLKYMVRAMKT